MNIGKRKETPVLTLLRGPDGTVTAVDDGVKGEGIERLEPAPAADVWATELEPFLTGCLSVLPDPLEDGWPRLGFLLFSLGAVDRYWLRRTGR